MRGIQIDVARFRQLRRARGLTQPELARLAGVSERTVRNAESGRRIRLEFLRYLALALGIEVTDVIHDHDELRTALLEQRRVDHILTAIAALTSERDVSEYISLATRNLSLNMLGPPEVPFCGEFRGSDGIRRAADISRECLLYERPHEVDDIRSSGNLVVISGRDWCRAVPTGKPFSTRWHHIYEFDKGRIVRFDDVGQDWSAIEWAFRPDE
jgi:transcriptional regulator with XRE-family HTH domain